MKKITFIICFFLLTVISGWAQLKTHSFEETEQLVKQSPKPVVVFIHTSWCKFCKMMEKSTFKNETIIQTLNDYFYFISLDAEQKEDITFNNQLFKFKSTGKNTGLHDLAAALGTINKEVTFPTLTILDKDYSIIFQKASFTDAKSLLKILNSIKTSP
jgi:thioredoxin-related protein